MFGKTTAAGPISDSLSISYGERERAAAARLAATHEPHHQAAPTRRNRVLQLPCARGAWSPKRPTQGHTCFAVYGRRPALHPVIWTNGLGQERAGRRLGHPEPRAAPCAGGARGGPPAGERPHHARVSTADSSRCAVLRATWSRGAARPARSVRSGRGPFDVDADRAALRSRLIVPGFRLQRTAKASQGGGYLRACALSRSQPPTPIGVEHVRHALPWRRAIGGEALRHVVQLRAPAPAAKPTGQVGNRRLLGSRL